MEDHKRSTHTKKSFVSEGEDSDKDKMMKDLTAKLKDEKKTNQESQKIFLTIRKGI